MTEGFVLRPMGAADLAACKALRDGELGFYAALGFVHYGRLERAVRVGTRFHDKDLMVLDLDRGRTTI